MKRIFLQSALLFMTALVIAPLARGADFVAVGDKPRLSVTVFPGTTTVDLADLRGEIVVVDFFASWCEPCMAQAEHLSKIEQLYAGKGLQLIGISLDSDDAQLKAALTNKGIDWPMAFDASGWSGKVPLAWGVDSIPQTFIIGPEGNVLWRGLPAHLDDALANAFKQHPPKTTSIKQIAGMQTGSTPGNSIVETPVPDAKAIADMEAAKTENEAAQLLADAKRLQASKKDDEAYRKFQAAAAERYVTTPSGLLAKAEVEKYESSKTFMSHLKALDLLRLADMAKNNGLLESARDKYNRVLNENPGTPDAERAKAGLKSIEGQ